MSTIKEKFLNWEKESDIYAIEVDGFAIWHIIRLSIFMAISKEDFSFEQVKRESSLVQKKVGTLKLFYLLKNILVFLSKIVQLKNTDVLIISKSENRQLSNYSYRDKYFDQIELEDENITILEFPDFSNKHLHYRIRYQDNQIIPGDIIYMLEVIVNKFAKEHDREISKIYKLLNAFVIDNFNTEIPLDRFNNNIKKMINRQMGRKKLFYFLLKYINPKALVLKSSYDPMSQLLLFYANKMNIKTIELQHGHIYSDHVGYIKPLVINNFINVIYPKILLIENAYYKEILEKNGWDSKKLLVSGDIVLKHSQVDNLRLKILKDKVARYSKVITIINQHTLSKEINERMKEVKAIKNCLFIIKLHPRLLAEQLHFFDKISKYENIILISTENSLEECFMVSDIVVGVYSTGVIDALKSGLDVKLLNLQGVEFLQDLIDKGVAERFNTFSEVSWENIEKGHTNEYRKKFQNNEPYNKLNSTIKHVLLKTV